MELSFFKSYTVALFYAVEACIITVFNNGKSYTYVTPINNPLNLFQHTWQTTSSRDETISTNSKTKQNKNVCIYSILKYKVYYCAVWVSKFYVPYRFLSLMYMA